MFSKIFLKLKNPFPNNKELMEISQKTKIPLKKIHSCFGYMRKADFCKEQKYVTKMKVLTKF